MTTLLTMKGFNKTNLSKSSKQGERPIEKVEKKEEEKTVENIEIKFDNNQWSWDVLYPTN